jgi:hypothetical protein
MGNFGKKILNEERVKFLFILFLLLHSLISIADDRSSCFASLKNITNETNELTILSVSILEKSTKTNIYRIPSEFVNLTLMSYAASLIPVSSQAMSHLLYLKKIPQKQPQRMSKSYPIKSSMNMQST